MFFFDSEIHLWPPMDDINYYPSFKMYVNSIMGIGHRLGFSKQTGDRGKGKVEADVDSLIRSMDEGGVQMGCVLPEAMPELSGGHRVRSTNGFIAEAVARYPGRLVGVANVGPILQRGVKQAIWELEYLVKERNFKACKLYPPDGDPINHKDLWPFYEKVEELTIPLFVHVGFAWVAPGKTQYCLPTLLEDVCNDFSEIPIVAYHMGYPYCNDLNMEAAKYKNLYIGTSLLAGLAKGRPRQAQKLVGEALAWATIDKLIWGSDWSGAMVRHKDQVDFLKNFQIGEEVQRDYGYPPLTDVDKAKWAGLNLARIMKIEPEIK